MDSADLQALHTLTSWLKGGRRAVLVTVAATWGSAPRPAGAWAAIRDDGAIAGSVSGGCVEDDLVARVRRGDFADGEPRVLRYGGTPDEARRFGLPCGGTLELVLEPRPDHHLLGKLRERLATRRPTVRRLDLATGRVTLADAATADTLAWDGRTLIHVLGPRHRLLLIGAGQVSIHLAAMAQVLDYEVFVCDPRDEYRTAWPATAGRLLDGMPDDVVRQLVPDARLAVVTLTHDPKLDDMALLEALEADLLYVGALGSRASSERRRQRLAEHFGIGPAALARLRGPAGLPIGSRTPAEIALSILAEVTAARNGVIPSAADDRRAPRAEAACSP